MSAKKPDPRNAAEKLVDKAEKVADDLTDALSPDGDVVPGAPGSEPPSVDEPTEPTDPLPPKPDQKGATPHSPTGAPSKDSEDAQRQQGAYLTTAQGARLSDRKSVV